MSIIKTTNKFQGNILDRNIQRIDTIKLTKQDGGLVIKIKKFIYYVKKCNINILLFIIENELFFEIIPVYIINKYVNKLNQFNNIENVLEEVYISEAENGFRRTMDYLVRRIQ
ncbi:hypothetical protein JY742_10210 [Clostridioides difficile]|nr:hypothetical protein [Clostridioides difficile]